VVKRALGDWSRVARVAGEPKYVAIATELVGRIADEEFLPGDFLPTETQLLEQYEVSRFTIRESLRYLAEHGLIVRRQGSGSRVIATRPSPTYVMGMWEEEFLQYSSQTSVELTRNSQPLPERLSTLLGAADPGEWSWFTGVRRSAPNNIAIGLVDIVLRNEYADVVSEAPIPTTGAVFARVTQQHGVVLDHIDQSVSAELVEPHAAALLECEAHVPGLRIVRKFIGDDGVFEITSTVHPSDRFQYSLMLRRKQ
jgi:GntR family transcriptional regulator